MAISSKHLTVQLHCLTLSNVATIAVLSLLLSTWKIANVVVNAHIPLGGLGAAEGIQTPLTRIQRPQGLGGIIK